MRQAVLNLEESMIRQVANAGMGRSDVLKFWFGESDEVTPQFIRDAAIASVQQGETFYAHNLGLPELREAIAAYTNGLRVPGATKIGANRVAVASGGVNALMLAVQALVNSGDEVVVVTPVWPNLTAQPAIMGAVVKGSVEAGGWTGGSNVPHIIELEGLLHLLDCLQRCVSLFLLAQVLHGPVKKLGHDTLGQALDGLEVLGAEVT
jgi:histidinol-phosphate/aromatic aminotransferase/cobyric acid decarboxylase-like protein